VQCFNTSTGLCLLHTKQVETPPSTSTPPSTDPLNAITPAAANAAAFCMRLVLLWLLLLALQFTVTALGLEPAGGAHTFRNLIRQHCGVSFAGLEMPVLSTQRSQRSQCADMNVK
jgi:hypothetical protein